MPTPHPAGTPRQGRWLALYYAMALSCAALAAWLATPVLRSGGRTADLRFDGGRAFAELTAFVEKFGPRYAEEINPEDPSRQGGNRAVAEHLAEKFRALGYADTHVVRETFTNMDLWNVVAADWRGAAPSVENSREMTLLAAHHDTVPKSPGAEDNASGVAAVLEAARVMREHGLQERVLFVVFDGEEIGGLGSRQFAGRYLKEEGAGIRLRAAITTEMLAWKNGRLVLHTIPRNFAATSEQFTQAALPSLMIRAAHQAGLPLRMGEPWMEVPYQAIVRSCRVPTGSDDIWFLREGVPSLFLASSSFFNFYSEYHRSSDTPEHLSPQVLEKSGRILEASLLELDKWRAEELAASPRNYVLPFGFVISNFYLALILPMGVLAVMVSRENGKRRRLLGFSLAGILLGGAASAALFYPAALVTLRGLTLGWPLACFARSRLVRHPAFWLGLAPFIVTFGVMGMARLSYGRSFQILITPGEWAAVALMLAAYVLSAVWGERLAEKRDSAMIPPAGA